MKKSELLSIVSDCKEYCKVTENTASSITFEVDDVKPRCKNMEGLSAKGIASHWLQDKNIPVDGFDLIASEMDADKACFIGQDVLYRCILQCYSEHRPLILSPDAVWLVINQALAAHINRNPEKYRDKLVYHEGKMELEVKTPTNILTEKTDWARIFESFYEQIEKNTKENIAEKMASDFTTTNATCRIASTITLMDAMQRFFRYVVHHMICGIPTITLQGNSDDWRKVLQKIELLKEFGLKWWYDYLCPVVSEFVSASEGKPNKVFWKSIVMKQQVGYLDHHKASGCIPWENPRVDVDGWFLVFFPYLREKKQSFVKHDKDEDMESEMSRVPFIYRMTDPLGGIVSETDMELWAGLIGVEENTETFALTPRVGWLVRKSHEMRGEDEGEIIFR